MQPVMGTRITAVKVADLSLVPNFSSGTCWLWRDSAWCCATKLPLTVSSDRPRNSRCHRGERCVMDFSAVFRSPPTVNLLSSNPAFDKLASALVLFPDARRDKKTKDHNENETVNVLRKYG